MKQPKQSNDERQPYHRLVTENQSNLYAFICYLLGGSEDAWDVLQETNLVLWEKADQFDPGLEFIPWALQIARFQVLAYRERHQRDRLIFSDGLIASLADETEGAAINIDSRLRALDRCLDQLASPHRDVIQRRYSHGEAVAEIATHLGRTANAVAAALYRIRRALAECVDRAIQKEGIP